MSPEVVELLSDALKILGPAIIAAYATYKVGRTQLDMKDKEIRAANEFKARERLFDYDLGILQGLDSSRDKTNDSLGQVMSLASTTLPDDPEFQLVVRLVKTMSVHVPRDIRSTKAEMAAIGLEDSDAYSGLDEVGGRANWVSVEETKEGLTNRLFEMLEVGTHLSHCRQEIAREHMHLVLKPYVELSLDG